MLRYSNKVLEHFRNPKNAGAMEAPDAVGLLGDPECGDFLELHLKIEDCVITDVRYLIRGCPAAIAVASALSELAKGRTLEEAQEITDDDVVEELGGLPEIKLHCSNLGANTLYLAIKDYFDRRQREA